MVKAEEGDRTESENPLHDDLDDEDLNSVDAEDRRQRR